MNHVTRPPKVSPFHLIQTQQKATKGFLSRFRDPNFADRMLHYLLDIERDPIEKDAIQWIMMAAAEKVRERVKKPALILIGSEVSQ